MATIPVGGKLRVFTIGYALTKHNKEYFTMGTDKGNFYVDSTTKKFHLQSILKCLNYKTYHNKKIFYGKRGKRIFTLHIKQHGSFNGKTYAITELFKSKDFSSIVKEPIELDIFRQILI